LAIDFIAMDLFNSLFGIAKDCLYSNDYMTLDYDITNDNMTIGYRRGHWFM